MDNNQNKNQDKPENKKPIILSTTEMIERKYEIIGIISCNKVLTRNLLKDIGAGLKSVVGGRLKTYEKMLMKTRNLAIEGLKDEARRLDGDAVVAIKQATSEIMPQAAEVMIFGTLVKFTDNK